MEYPQRIDTHISESISFSALSSVLPKEWIVRELTERDYGVDLYVELVGKNGKVTGDLVALQVKSANSVQFNDKGFFTYSGIKKSTINYWIGLPVPVFLIVVDLSNKHVYWSSVEINQREGRFSKNNKTSSLILTKDSDFSESGLALFRMTYIREKRWPEIESAIEKSIMSYNSLGPLVLMCKRKGDNEFCSTSIQYMLIQHYEFFTLLSRYLLLKKPEYLPYWYDRHVEYLKNNKLERSLTFSYKVVKDMVEYFIWDYRDCIIASYQLVTESQKIYFSKKLPYLYMHLQQRPHAFVMDDWAARYYFDEYENETTNPEELFFQDFEKFDWILSDLTKT
ncbi:DUF4365 domain-containing protein [Aeromonas veronii]